VTYLTSDPRMSDREKVCAEKWLKAAIDDNDPDLADYWKEQGMIARQDRLRGDGEDIPEPPIPEYKKVKHDPLPVPCDVCRKVKCKNYACLL
jgi:hypothetical protein